MRGYLNTIDDMLRLAYAKSGAGMKYIRKDAPVISTTTGVYNAVYGAEAWRQLNQMDTAFGLIPKVPWSKSGWRVITTRADAITTPTGGIAEGAALPATVKPAFLEVSTKPKEVVRTFNVSTKQEFLAKVSNDDCIGDLEFMKAYMGIEHKEHIDAMLLKDVDTTANTNFESIDRVCSSYAEVTNCGITAGDSDIYSLDRDAAASWADAYVSHASGVDRALTDPILRTHLMNVNTNGGRPSIMLTGFDTYANAQGLYGDQARYNNPMKEGMYTATVNGVETVNGTEVGMNISTIYGIPLFQDVHVAKDTGSRIYTLDTSNKENFEIPRICFKVAQPTSYYESRDLFANDALAYEGMYLTMGELICSFFGAQGKIRDLL
jgi:hypothetical protein